MLAPCTINTCAALQGVRRTAAKSGVHVATLPRSCPTTTRAERLARARAAVDEVRA